MPRHRGDIGARGDAAVKGISTARRLSALALLSLAIAGSVAAGGISAGGFADAFRDALGTRAQGAAGLKSVAAYRVGLDLAAGRPSEGEVAEAAGRWLGSAGGEAGAGERPGAGGEAGGGRSSGGGGWPGRLADPVLHRFLIWCGVDLGMPIQFHVGYGDRDVDLILVPARGKPIGWENHRLGKFRVHEGGETGLDVEPIELIELLDRVHREGERVRYHYVIADYLCRVTGGELRGPKQIADFYQKMWATGVHEVREPTAIIIDNKGGMMAVEESVSFTPKPGFASVTLPTGEVMKAGEKWKGAAVMIFTLRDGKVTSVRGSIVGAGKITRAE